MGGYRAFHGRARTLLLAAALGPALLLPAASAHAQEHRQPSGALVKENHRPWIVSLGDSYISGEAGRWAGNTDLSYTKTDALGPTAYYDNPSNTGELIPLCHRSKSAEIHVGGGVESLNLACSGARTYTFTDGSGHFKPGLDFYKSGGNQGQALMLEEFAKTHRVTMVAVSIGGNDFGFGDIVTTCVLDFLRSTAFSRYHCNDEPSVRAHFSDENVAHVTAHIAEALRNIHEAMALAGYPESAYKILLQDYPAPIPHGSAFRYPEFGYERQTVGGCGMWNDDADWALDYALPRIDEAVFDAAAQSGLRNIAKLDITPAFHDRRLCQNTVGLLEEKGLNSWKDQGAVDETEWINQIKILTFGTPYFQQESLHPDYWGQLALRNCVRQAYNDGAIRGGTCARSGTGLDARGEPKMKLS